jgi:hypothetical protein
VVAISMAADTERTKDPPKALKAKALSTDHSNTEHLKIV